MPLDQQGFVIDAPAKADPFTLDSLIAWLETMPADRVYNFFDCDGRCLIGQYIAAKSSSNHWRHYGYPNWMDLVDAHPHVSKIATHEPFTFGAALLRARALKAQGA